MPKTCQFSHLKGSFDLLSHLRSSSKSSLTEFVLVNMVQHPRLRSCLASESDTKMFKNLSCNCPAVSRKWKDTPTCIERVRKRNMKLIPLILLGQHAWKQRFAWLE